MDFEKVKPQSVFNTQHVQMIKLLQRLSHQRDENITLHSHQVEAALKLYEYFDPQKNPQNQSSIALVVLPTGCGKTGVAVLASYALNASRVLVITPSIIISRQIHKAYGDFLIKCGVIEDTPTASQSVLPTRRLINKSSEIREGMSSSVMVVNAHKIGGQSTVKIEDIPPDGYDLVIVDEAHHYPAQTWKLLVDHFSNSQRLFLTATPEHRGKPIMHEIGIPIIPCYELRRSEAVDRGIIRNVDFKALEGGLDYESQCAVSLILFDHVKYTTLFCFKQIFFPCPEIVKF